jgi:hypothetical protein
MFPGVFFALDQKIAAAPQVPYRVSIDAGVN